VGSMYGQTADTPAYGLLSPTASAYGPYGQSGGKGSFWGLAGALLAGGSWRDAAGCGSRARAASYARSYASSALGGRGRRHRAGAYANSTAGHFALSSCLVNRQNTKQRGCVVSSLKRRRQHSPILRIFICGGMVVYGP
jgi:hypothetical protein